MTDSVLAALSEIDDCHFLPYGEKQKKKNRKIIKFFRIVAAVSAVILMFGGTLTVYASKKARLRKSMVATYENKSIYDIADPVKEADSAENVNLADTFALGDKLSEAGTPVLNFLINANDKFPVVQSLLFEIAEEYNLKIDSELVRKILHDSEKSKEVRIAAFYYCSSVGEEYLEEIKKLTKDSEFVIIALRALYYLDSVYAVATADDILYSQPDTWSREVNAALLVKSFRLAESATQEELTRYIAQCDRLLSNAGEDEKSVIFSYISYVNRYETLSYLVHTGYMTDEEKYYYIGLHMELILTMLGEPADEEKTETLLCAIKYGFHPEFYDVILAYLKNNKSFFEEHSDLDVLAQEALTAVETELQARGGTTVPYE